MTKKHFMAIADALLEERSGARKCRTTVDAVDRIAKRIAAVCKKLNSRFDTERFLSACREV